VLAIEWENVEHFAMNRELARIDVLGDLNTLLKPALGDSRGIEVLLVRNCRADACNASLWTTGETKALNDETTIRLGSSSMAPNTSTAGIPVAYLPRAVQLFAGGRQRKKRRFASLQVLHHHWVDSSVGQTTHTRECI
jgi:hypothetical protein